MLYSKIVAIIAILKYQNSQMKSLIIADNDDDNRFRIHEAIRHVDQHTQIIQALDGLDLLEKIQVLAPENILLVLIDLKHTQDERAGSGKPDQTKPGPERCMSGYPLQRHVMIWP